MNAASQAPPMMLQRKRDSFHVSVLSPQMGSPRHVPACPAARTCPGGSCTTPLLLYQCSRRDCTASFLRCGLTWYRTPRALAEKCPGLTASPRLVPPRASLQNSIPDPPELCEQGSLVERSSSQPPIVTAGCVAALRGERARSDCVDNVTSGGKSPKTMAVPVVEHIPVSRAAKSQSAVVGNSWYPKHQTSLECCRQCQWCASTSRVSTLTPALS